MSVKPEPTGSATLIAQSEAAYGLRFMRKHYLRLILAFLGILLPLLGFATLVEDLRESNVFFFDMPILVGLHQMATPGIDRFFMLMSKLGYEWGVVPVNIGILAWLIYRRRFRDGLFFGLAVIGSLLINLAAKNHFARVRPELWLSMAPETTFSFPSGHAMGSATLGVALMLLFWPTRGRWWVVSVAAMFILLVGMSRVYLGVHYPSDILAGWSAGTAWVMAMYYLVASRAPAPPSTPAVAAGHDALAEAKVPKIVAKVTGSANAS